MLSSDADDSIDLLTQALANYLTELDGWGTDCLRHADTAIVTEERGLLCVSRRFPRSPVTVAHLRTSPEKLRSLRTSLFWKSDGERWKEIIAMMTTGAGESFCQGANWDERPLAVRWVMTDDAITLDLLSLPYSSDMTDHPLRALARLLRCHEFLVATMVASPIAARTWMPQGGQTIGECVADLRRYVT